MANISNNHSQVSHHLPHLNSPSHLTFSLFWLGLDGRKFGQVPKQWSITGPSHAPQKWTVWQQDSCRQWEPCHHRQWSNHKANPRRLLSQELITEPRQWEQVLGGQDHGQQEPRQYKSRGTNSAGRSQDRWHWEGVEGCDSKCRPV